MAGRTPYLTYKYLLSASLAALVISTFASWFFYSRWSESENRYTALLIEKNDASQNYDLIRSASEEMASDLAVIRDSYTTVFQLNPIDSTKNFMLRVYWNKYSKQTYADVIALPHVDSTFQFHLWAKQNQTIVDGGLLNVSAEIIQRLNDQPGADAWALTLEQRNQNSGFAEGTPVLFSSHW